MTSLPEITTHYGERTCARDSCGIRFIAQASQHRYCSYRCRKQAYEVRARETKKNQDLVSQTGARKFPQYNVADDFRPGEMERLNALIDIDSDPHGCWLWLGCAPQGKPIWSVRYTDGRDYSSISVGRLVFNVCYDTPVPSQVRLGRCPAATLCVNPEHLQPESSMHAHVVFDGSYDPAIVCARGHLRTRFSRLVSSRPGGGSYLFCRECNRLRQAIGRQARGAKPRRVKKKQSWADAARSYLQQP